MISLSYHYIAKLGMVAFYKANTEYITEVFCENKDKPALKCNGKCYLNKQLEKVDSQSSSESDDKNTVKVLKIELSVFLNTIIRHHFIFEEVSTIQSFAYMASYQFMYLSSCFHPPNID